MTQTVVDPAVEIERLNALISHLNAVNTILFNERNHKDTLLAEANNHRGILQTALAQRDAEIARLTAELASRPPLEPPPAPQPTPLPPDPPLEPEPVPPTPSEPPQPETPIPTPPIEPEPLPPNPTPPAAIVADLALEATFQSISISLPGSFPPASDVGYAEYRKTGEDWQVADWKGEPLPLWSVGTALLGSIRECEPGTDYEVRVVTPDGVRHVGSVRTWPEILATRESLLAGVG